MYDEIPHSRASEAKIRELTDAIENGKHNYLVKYLNQLPSPAERVQVLQRIAELNNENRYKSGRTPRLAVESISYPGSDFTDVALLKKSDDWLFRDDVLYKESVWKH